MYRLLALERGFGHPMGASGPWVMDPRKMDMRMANSTCFPGIPLFIAFVCRLVRPEAPVTVRLEVREKAEKPAPDIRQPRLQRIILSL